MTVILVLYKIRLLGSTTNTSLFAQKHSFYHIALTLRTNMNEKDHARKAIIEGKSYPISPAMFGVMRYFAESQAICQTDTHILTTITIQIWELMLSILESFNFNPPHPPSKIRNNSIRDYLPAQLIQRFDHAPIETLNRLYQACHFLKVEVLKKSIAVYFACRIHFSYTKKGYQSIKKQLGVTRDLTHAKMTCYQQRFPFIN